MNSKEGPGHKREQGTMPMHESDPQAKDQISLMVNELQGFNSNTSNIMNSAHEAGVDIEKNDLQELEKLSEETVSAKKEFFKKILNEQELERYNQTLEKGETERASTITNSILKKVKNLTDNKSFQKIINPSYLKWKFFFNLSSI